MKITISQEEYKQLVLCESIVEYINKKIDSNDVDGLVKGFIERYEAMKEVCLPKRDYGYME